MRLSRLLRTRLQDPLHPSLGREQDVLAQPLYHRVVACDELERELEAAGIDDVKEVIDAGRHHSLLPTGDHGPLATTSLRSGVSGSWEDAKIEAIEDLQPPSGEQ